ncbi:MAG: DUF433 domain-containing protein [Ginsengibacter sp.]
MAQFVSLNKLICMNWKEYISSDPEIMFGKMVIKGTRIPVELILEKLAADFSFDDLKQAYPRITTIDIQACLLFAADNSKHEKTLALVQ